MWKYLYIYINVYTHIHFPPFFFHVFFAQVAPSSAPGRSEGDLSGPDPMDPWVVHQPGF